MRTHNFVLSKVDVSDMKIKLISQHAAIVTSLAQVEGTNDGRPLHGSFRYTRVYQRLPNGTWKITSFEATHIPHHHDQHDAHPDEAAVPPNTAPATPPASAPETHQPPH
jgi:hypothetical protein